MISSTLAYFVLLLCFYALGWFARGQLERERRRRRARDVLVPSHGIILALQRAERRRSGVRGRKVRPRPPR